MQWSSGDRNNINGEVRFTASANGRAGAAGSLTQKYMGRRTVARSVRRGAHRTHRQGSAVGIGDQVSVTMPASGTLYLGVNDDNVSDNSGQFQVVISW